MKILWLDTETTGLDPKINDIVQISCIYENEGNVVDTFNCFLRPSKPENIQEEALSVQKRTYEEVMGYPTANFGFTKFVVGFLDKHVNRFDKNDKFFLAGQFVDFDKEFLYNLFQTQGNKFFYSYFFKNTIDLKQFATVLKAYGMINPNTVRLADLAEYLGFEFEGKHDSRYDIAMTKKVFDSLKSRFIDESKRY